MGSPDASPGDTAGSCREGPASGSPFQRRMSGSWAVSLPATLGQPAPCAGRISVMAVGTTIWLHGGACHCVRLLARLHFPCTGGRRDQRQVLSLCLPSFTRVQKRAQQALLKISLMAPSAPALLPHCLPGCLLQTLSSTLFSISCNHLLEIYFFNMSPWKLESALEQAQGGGPAPVLKRKRAKPVGLPHPAQDLSLGALPRGQVKAPWRTVQRTEPPLRSPGRGTGALTGETGNSGPVDTSSKQRCPSPLRRQVSSFLGPHETFISLVQRPGQ